MFKLTYISRETNCSAGSRANVRYLITVYGYTSIADLAMMLTKVSYVTFDPP